MCRTVKWCKFNVSEREKEREREGREGGREGERRGGNLPSTLFALSQSQLF